MIRAVCFDLGGVIVRIHRTWDDATAAAGLTMPSAPHAAAFWKDEQIVRLWQSAHLAHHRGSIGGAEYFSSVADLSRGQLSVQDVERVHAAWLIGEYPEVDALIQRLGDCGYLTACLSNTNDYHWEQMANRADYPAVSRLTLRLASHELGLLKPEREIYETALERFGCRADEVLFFDDLEENVQGARAAGWRAFRIDPHASPAQQMQKALVQHGVNLDEVRLGG